MLLKQKTKKILFLHGWLSTGESKTFFLKCLGFDVSTPVLSNWLFQDAVKNAQDTFDRFNPDLVVGSSRGGAVALNINSGNTPLILLAPAWKHFGNVDKAEKSNIIVIHSAADTMIRHQDSIAFVDRSVSGIKLVTAGNDHRLNCTEGQKELRNAIVELLQLVEQPN